MRLDSRYACCFAFILVAAFAGKAAADEVYGPVNLLKARPNPFVSSSRASSTAGVSALGPFTLNGASAPAAGDPQPGSDSTAGQSLMARRGRSLSERLVTSRLYLPGRLVMGKTAEFSIKGKPGAHVALAMADKDSGARAIFGHTLRLGPDRKVVAVGDIPECGIVNLYFEAPIEGDLIGENLFFEAAIWSRPDYSDLEIATPVSSEGQEGVRNGVIIAKENEKKTGIQVVPDGTVQLQQRLIQTQNPLDSGRP